MRFEWVVYIKLLLTAVSSLFAAVLLPSVVWWVRNSMHERATGLSLLAGGLLERALSPGFWITFIFLISFFYITGTLARGSLRVIFFWVPTILICSAGFALWGLMVYVVTHAPRG
jgi:hypothetical protein